MSNAKFEVEKFTGKSNFALWKLKVRDLLVQQGFHKALDGATKKPATMTDLDWENLMPELSVPSGYAWRMRFSSTLLKRVQLQV